MDKSSLVATEEQVFEDGTKERVTSWRETSESSPLKKTSTKRDPIKQTKNDAKLASLIYNINTDDSKEELRNILTGYDIIAVTTDLAHTHQDSHYQYQAVAAINYDTKEVIVITAGTRLTNGIKNITSDTRDNLYLGIGFYPQKIYAAQRLNDRILQKLGDDNIKDYHFHYTGHSLGATLSDSAATDMGIKLHKKSLLTKNKISTVTFDNPGSYTIVKSQLTSQYFQDKECEIKRHKNKMKEISKMKGSRLLGATFKQWLSKQEARSIEQMKHREILEELSKTKLTLNADWAKKINYKTFNNRPNLINTLDKQSGETFIIVPTEQTERNSFFTFVGWVASKCPVKIIKRILYVISYGSLTEQIAEHSIDNFINFLKEENGKLIYKNSKDAEPTSLDEAAYNIKPIKYEEKLFKELKKTIARRPKASPNHEEPDHSMTFESDDKSYGTRIEFTKDELNLAKENILKHSTQHIFDEIKNHFNDTQDHKHANSHKKPAKTPIAAQKKEKERKK